MTFLSRKTFAPQRLARGLPQPARAPSTMTVASSAVTDAEVPHAASAWEHWRKLGAPRFHVAPMVDQVSCSCVHDQSTHFLAIAMLAQCLRRTLQTAAASVLQPTPSGAAASCHQLVSSNCVASLPLLLDGHCAYSTQCLLGFDCLATCILHSLWIACAPQLMAVASSIAPVRMKSSPATRLCNAGPGQTGFASHTHSSSYNSPVGCGSPDIHQRRAGGTNTAHRVQSELPFRMLCRRHGATAAYTPMLHARLFAEGAAYRAEHFSTAVADRPLFVQFCANDPAVLVRAAQHVDDDSCDYVDLNFGCPQRIAKRGNYGAYLMDDLPKAESLVRALHEVCSASRPRLRDCLRCSSFGCGLRLCANGQRWDFCACFVHWNMHTFYSRTQPP